MMNRRAFLAACGSGALALTVGAGSGCLAGAAPSNLSSGGAPRRPNVVFVLADDLGWRELGCYGNTFNETPHLDRLASSGVRFTHAYAAAPVCSPYRAALMTGQWPARVGITDYLRPADPKHLATEHTTLAEVFKAAGYATGMIGKWHLTGYAHHGAEEVRPTAHGFDEAIVSERRGIGGGSYWHPYHFDPDIAQRLHDKEYLVDRVNVEAVEFIERHKHEPFFLYVSHYAVHTRLVGQPELVAKYASRPGAGKGPNAPKNNPHLAAQLETIDEGVGMIVRKLDELGLADDTVLVFTGDNGGEDRVTSNAPLRAGKSTLYEGGIREPLIVRWPGLTPPGAVCRTPTVNCDFYPTFREALGAGPDAGHAVDGVSILPLLADPSARLPRDTFYWHYPLAKPHFLGGRSAGAIRKGDWKLIEFFDTGTAELYHLADDAGERHDLAAAQPQRAKDLRRDLAAWRKRVGATIPPECRGYDPKAKR
jgi:arylsulfatase A-like enzyme